MLYQQATKFTQNVHLSFLFSLLLYCFVQQKIEREKRNLEHKSNQRCFTWWAEREEMYRHYDEEWGIEEFIFQRQAISAIVLRNCWQIIKMLIAVCCLERKAGRRRENVKFSFHFGHYVYHAYIYRVLAIVAPCQENKLAKETFEAIWRLLNLIPEIAFACSNFWE